MWSADPRQLWTFPARFLVAFFERHGMLGLRNRPRWYTVAGGSQRYVDAILAPLAGRVRSATPIAAVARHRDHVELTLRGGPSERFDHPVFTPRGVAAQQRWRELDGHERTSYCGACWGWGFHEDGVVSAVRACERLGAGL